MNYGVQVRLKVAIDFHQADSRDLHLQIEALSNNNTPWETLSETSSVVSAISSHIDIEVLIYIHRDIRETESSKENGRKIYRCRCRRRYSCLTPLSPLVFLPRCLLNDDECTRESHVTCLQDEGILLPLREQIRAAGADAVACGGIAPPDAARRGLSEHSSSNFNKKMGARNSIGVSDASSHHAHLANKHSAVSRRTSLPTSCILSNTLHSQANVTKDTGASLTAKIEKIRTSMDHMLRVSLSPTYNRESTLAFNEMSVPAALVND